MAATKNTIEFFSAILLVTHKMAEMVAFYRDVLGFELRPEMHDDENPHFGCELGDIHFAIHPAGAEQTYGAGSIRMAFNIFDINSFVREASARGAQFLYPPVDVGFALMTALTDPDGNYVEITQLSDSWFSHLEKRRRAGADIVSAWKNLKAAQRK